MTNEAPGVSRVRPHAGPYVDTPQSNSTTSRPRDRAAGVLPENSLWPLLACRTRPSGAV